MTIPSLARVLLTCARFPSLDGLEPWHGPCISGGIMTNECGLYTLGLCFDIEEGIIYGETAHDGASRCKHYRSRRWWRTCSRFGCRGIVFCKSNAVSARSDAISG